MNLLKSLVLFWVLLGAPVWAAPPAGIDWQAYSAEVFARARQENRLVLLELEAVWCHWCHVMDEKTWNQPAVAAAVSRGFIPVRVDHDARPDLAERYRDYGWPAIIILDGEGRDLVKRAGYIPPEKILDLLARISAHPVPDEESPEAPQWSLSPLLAPDAAAELEARFLATHDFRLGGLKGEQKFVDRDATEYALLLASRGDRRALTMVRNDMQAVRRLSDPVWGGVYQYSTDGDWDHPHYEKLAVLQADYLRVTALSYAALKTPEDRVSLERIRAYLNGFLRSPEGSYYVSQDADLRPGEHAEDYFALPDAARRAQGLPRVDRHVYARENGLLAEAFATAYQATGDASWLADARTALTNMRTSRRLPQGGYSHDATDRAGPYLADNLAMLRGLLALYAASGERDWLAEARSTADFIDREFRNGAEPGFLSAVRHGPLAPVPTLEENLALARVSNLLFHYSGEASYRSMAERAMRYLVTPAVALARRSDPGILLAAAELASEPAHLTVVGHRDEPLAIQLFQAATAWPQAYKRIEWWDRREGALPHADVAYPALARTAAYVCTAGRCSRPLFSPDELLTLARELNRPKEMP